MVSVSTCMTLVTVNWMRGNGNPTLSGSVNRLYNECKPGVSWPGGRVSRGGPMVPFRAPWCLTAPERAGSMVLFHPVFEGVCLWRFAWEYARVL